MRELNLKLSENVVFAAIDLGIDAVQKIAAESLKMRPGMSLKDFTHVLDKYVNKAKVIISNNPS